MGGVQGAISLHSDGRIVDTGNGGVSHTEGQGWGLLFAVTFDDAEAFKTILNWTTLYVAPRPGCTALLALCAWRINQVPDVNNATDGDLFIAMALSRAAGAGRNPPMPRWQRPLLRIYCACWCVVPVRELCCYPACTDLKLSERSLLNPSYYAFPAMQELADPHTGSALDGNAVGWVGADTRRPVRSVDAAARLVTGLQERRNAGARERLAGEVLL